MTKRTLKVENDYQKETLGSARLRVIAYTVACVISLVGFYKSARKVGTVRAGIIAQKAAECAGMSEEFNNGLRELLKTFE